MGRKTFSFVSAPYAVLNRELGSHVTFLFCSLSVSAEDVCKAQCETAGHFLFLLSPVYFLTQMEGERSKLIKIYFK